MKTRELCKRLNLTPRMMQWWREHRLIQAKVVSGRGGGAYGVCGFDEADALLVAIMAELRHKGLSLDQVRKLKLKAAAVTGDFLVTTGSKALYCSEGELLAAVEASACGCYVVCLSDLRARLTAPVKKARRAPAKVRRRAA